MLIRNNTHYFSEYSRFYNVVPDSHSFKMESSRRMGFFQRLYYEFEYTKSVGGIAYFYTLTYNDRSIPTFKTRTLDDDGNILEEIHNVFNYDHIRLVSHGALEKRLLRDHHARLRYFCACETGEGKGKRGLGHNPHYHFIFFITPLDDGYKFVDAWSFGKYIQELWQGKAGFCDWRYARFGHAQAGANLGQVISSDCLSYVGKYVVKDNNDLDLESKVYNHFFLECKQKYLDYRSIYRFYQTLKSENPYYDKYKFFTKFGLHNYFFFKRRIRKISYADWVHDVADNFTKSQVLELKDWFVKTYCPSYAQDGLNKFLNKYSGKVRCSKNLGIYGIQFIQNPDFNPRFCLNLSSEYREQYPCLFYIRKLYYDVVKCPYTGNPLYVLNERGRSLKLFRLQTDIDNVINSVREAISYIVYNDIDASFEVPKLEYFRSHIPEFDKYFYEDFKKFDFKLSFAYKILNEFIHYDNDGVTQSEILRRYAIYKIVYQYRCYDKRSTISLDLSLSLDSVKEDYNWFLQQNIYLLDYDSGSIWNLCGRNHLPMFSFDSIIQFSPYIKFFNFFDLILDLVSSYKSDASKAKFADKSRLQSVISSVRFNSYVG